MISHQIFSMVAGALFILWGAALAGYLLPAAKRSRFPLGHVALSLGLLVLVGYIGWLWHVLEHPPLRTLRDTLLWCTFLMPIIGLIYNWRRQVREILVMAIITGLIFLVGTLYMPDSMDKSLPPALQSPWFAPHVLVYMLAYSTFAIAFLFSLWALFRDLRRPKTDAAQDAIEAKLLVYIGFPLMATGMIFGAYWAKVAWGNYWGWDPKETWAFITWAIYLAFIHIERYTKFSPRIRLGMVAGAFAVLLMCWYFVNMLPSAQTSVHTYSMNE